MSLSLVIIYAAIVLLMWLGVAAYRSIYMCVYMNVLKSFCGDKFTWCFTVIIIAIILLYFTV